MTDEERAYQETLKAHNDELRAQAEHNRDERERFSQLSIVGACVVVVDKLLEWKEKKDWWPR